MDENRQPLPQPEAPAPEPEPRRVGTVTMGITLVASGIVLLAGQFGLLSVVEVLRWSPVILIMLGIETLVGCALAKGGKMRYDILSMFICFILIGVAAAGAVITEVVRGVVDGLLSEAAAYGSDLADILKALS